MARAVLTTLTAYDYKNLQQRYSEKNIINQTNGQEYIISTASRTNLTDIHGASMSKPAKVVTSNTITDMHGYETDKYNYVDWGVYERDYYIRCEAVITEGSFSIETDQIITNPNTVSVGWEIKYDHYYNDNYWLTSSDYSSMRVRFKSLEDERYKQNTNGYLVTENILPENAAAAVEEDSILGVFGVQHTRQTAGGMGLIGTEGITRKYVQRLANNHYRVDVDYRFATWWGYNTIRMKFLGGFYEKTATLYAARQIDFTISANTVEAKEVEFNYKSSIPLLGGAQGKNYSMESNEFLQTDESTSPNQRQSAAVSSEIFSKFDNDRTIVSFVLLNCEKYVVDGEERYLRPEDLIYIKDENGEFLTDDNVATGEQTPSVFEIIKTRPIWNGSFEMEVTCRKVDMTT